MKIAKSYVLNGKCSCMVFPGIMCVQIKLSTKNENAIKQTKNMNGHADKSVLFKSGIYGCTNILC